MKMTMKYGETNLRRLIRNDLARRGIPVSDDDITFKRKEGVAIVDIEVDDEEIPVADIAAATHEPVQHLKIPPLPNEVAPTPPPKQPALEVVEGGNNPTDFSDVIRASNKTAANKPGMFPAPTRELMDGESHEFPGGKR